MTNKNKITQKFNENETKVNKYKCLKLQTNYIISKICKVVDKHSHLHAIK